MRIKGQEKGIALIMVFLIIVTITVIVGSFLYMISSQLKSAGADISNAKALWLAEAGVQKVVYNFKTSASYRASPTSLSENIFGGTYTALLLLPAPDAQGNYNFASTGTFAGVSRKITCSVIGGSVFNYAGFGRSSVTMSGAAVTDSYDSRLGRYNVNGNKGYNGDIGGNVDISVSGSPYVNGNASIGPSGSFSDPIHRYIYGTVSNTNNVSLPAVTVPSSLTGLVSGGAIAPNNQNVSIGPGNYKYSTINLNGIDTLTINATTGPVNIYLTGNNTSISIANSAQIVIPATNTQPVTFYTDGSTSVSGAGVVNNTYIPSNLLLYSPSSRAITISNSGSFYGAIYAPSASVTVSGAAVIYGSAIANSLTLSNSGTVHYDKALTNVPLSGTSSYSVKSWREVAP